MPGLDGFGVNQKLKDKKIPLPHFILATAYYHYALEAFRWEALNYLLKPIEKDRLAWVDPRVQGGGRESQSAATGRGSD